MGYFGLQIYHDNLFSEPFPVGYSLCGSGGLGQCSSATRTGGYWVKSMSNSMLVNKIIKHGFWLAGGCAANQLDATYENLCWLPWNLTWKFHSNPVPRWVKGPGVFTYVFELLTRYYLLCRMLTVITEYEMINTLQIYHTNVSAIKHLSKEMEQHTVPIASGFPYINKTHGKTEHSSLCKQRSIVRIFPCSEFVL